MFPSIYKKYDGIINMKISWEAYFYLNKSCCLANKNKHGFVIRSPFSKKRKKRVGNRRLLGYQIFFYHIDSTQIGGFIVGLQNNLHRWEKAFICHSWSFSPYIGHLNYYIFILRHAAIHKAAQASILYSPHNMMRWLCGYWYEYSS